MMRNPPTGTLWTHVPPLYTLRIFLAGVEGQAVYWHSNNELITVLGKSPISVDYTRVLVGGFIGDIETYKFYARNELREVKL